MSSPTPVHVSGLDPATAFNDSDYFLINQGTVDRKLAATFVKAINWGAIPTTTTLNSNDEVLIYQGGGSAKVAASKFMFPSGTKLWFFQNANPDPANWTVIAYPGDGLLALRGGTTYTTGGSIQGDWQQGDVSGVPGNGLNLNQIPNHVHNIICGRDTDNTDITHVKGTRNNNPSPRPRAPTEGITGSSKALGQCDPHNHGNAWRPQAYVGIICQKN